MGKGASVRNSCDPATRWRRQFQGTQVSTPQAGLLARTAQTRFMPQRLALRALAQHATRFRQLDVPLHVGWEKESALLQRLGGLLHGRHVPVVGLIAFLERQT
jgi:hypothetical protein